MKDLLNKDFIDNIIDLFINAFKDVKGINYVISLGKKNYYSGIDRSYVGNLISVYRRSKPDSDTETAMKHFDELFRAILKFNHSSAYLNQVTLYKICYKLNDYRLSMMKRKSSSPVQSQDHGLIAMNNLPPIKFVTDETFNKLTKIPQQKNKGYSEEELGIIREELYRLSAAKNENYTDETLNEWIRCFAEMNWSIPRIVKSIKMAKVSPAFVKGFAMFTSQDTNEYYSTYKHDK